MSDMPAPPEPRHRGLLARQLRRSFAQVVIVATLACGVLLLFLARVAGSVHEMQRDEAAIRQGLDLAIAIREQYIHAAHGLIEGSRDHLPHYAEWVRRVREGAHQLQQHVAESERWRLDSIEQASREMDALFRSELLPAALAGDFARVRVAHGQLEGRALAAAALADQLARAAEARMSHAHVDTTQITYVAAALALCAILLLVVLSVASIRKLRDVVMRPLAALAESAHRVGRGEFGQRPTIAAEGELGLVSDAFDRMAEELSQRQRRLVASERMAAIGQLAAGVAHEINNPIGIIRGYLRTMIPEAERKELRDELNILDEEAAACQRIAEDLLAYARVPELARSELDVGELLRQVGERFDASGGSRERPVRVQAESARMALDPVRMKQVLQNLLRNAAQASPPGAAIELEGRAAEGSSYVIRVADRGHGMPPELRARVFEPFLSGRADGAGLGLAVCDGIVRAHGGTIEALPRAGGGTEVVVTLPGSPPPAEARGA